MGEARDDPRIFLVDPEKRGVIDPAQFHVPRRLARTVRANPFEITIDKAFAEVVDACAASGPGRMETWINQPIQQLYDALHRDGHGHSLECWKDGVLVGGLYGVSIGGAFFGESMFSRERDASKVALVHLVGRLCAGNYSLLDCQFMTDHLSQFGTREITKHDYKARLASAVKRNGDFGALQDMSGYAALQAISQAS
jgi:leucyl/phenylalanyl-tRNA--protein transferase